MLHVDSYRRGLRDRVRRDRVGMRDVEVQPEAAIRAGERRFAEAAEWEFNRRGVLMEITCEERSKDSASGDEPIAIGENVKSVRPYAFVRRQHRVEPR